MFGRQPSLLFCIIMDLIGCASYAIPALGEISDIFWAPLSGIIFFLSFGGWKGALGHLSPEWTASAVSIQPSASQICP